MMILDNLINFNDALRILSSFLVVLAGISIFNVIAGRIIIFNDACRHLYF